MKIIETTNCWNSERNPIFKDINVLDYDYQPSESPVRKKELEKLLKMFEPVLTSHTPQFAVIDGPVGSGKTELVKRFSELFKKQALENGVNVQFEFINCRWGYTNSAIVMKILNRFQPNFRDVGHSTNRMLRMLSKNLEKQNVHMIVVLDEADILIEKCSSKLIYQLSTFSKKGSLSLILLSQKDVYDMLDSSFINLFNPDYVIHLNKFTREEILVILNQRVKLAFYQNTVEPGVVELISDIVSDWGDVRYAIELLEKAGMLADEDNEEYITLDHVRTAKAETYSTITERKLKALNPHEKLILLAVAQSLRHKAYTNTDEVEYRYSEGCISFSVNRLAHKRFLEGLKVLAKYNLIVMADVEGGDQEMMTMSLHDISARSLEAKLIELYCIDKKRKV